MGQLRLVCACHITSGTYVQKYVHVYMGASIRTVYCIINGKGIKNTQNCSFHLLVL
jgi:hypothetical protein